MIQIQRQLQSHLIKPYAKLPSSQMLTLQQEFVQHLDPASNGQKEAETLPHVKRLNIFLLTKIVTLEIGWYFFSLKIS